MIQATPIPNSVQDILDDVYPIGSIYIETNGVNPAITFGIGTWTQFAKGRVIIGAGTSDETFTNGQTGGESAHTLSAGESGLPAHSHVTFSGGAAQPGTAFDDSTRRITNNGTAVNNNASSSGNAGPSNASAAHNNLQPYIVAYIWQRIG